MNTSNFARLKELFRRAAAGQELTIGFLGGSITQGSLSTQPGNAYAFRVYQWFVDTFPQSKFHYVNGGIGGTDSLYGVARAVTDVLMYQPDFVVVDFSVNDLEVPFRQETYEGVVRKLLAWPSHPAVVLLNNIYYDTGETSQDEHNAVGDHYGVPHVSIRDSIYKDLRAGKYASRTLLSPDGLHPNDYGHGLVAGEIIKLLEAVNAHREEPEQEPAFPAPLTANAYENARRLTPVLAAADGTVTETGFDTERGNYLMIDHGDGLYTIYMHASKLYVSTGQSVSKGATIAAVGSTGRSTGPHLHFSVRSNGSYVSPWNYLK